MKYYITTSIAYANAAPHIGFALESIQADVVARYHRQKGDEVYFLTGTDEHGSKIYKTALDKGAEPQDFVNEISEEFKNLKNILNLSWDDFIRTTDQQKHWPGVFEIWKRINESGDIEKRKYSGLYCVGCEEFKTEKDLVDGKCPIHLKEPELIEEENYFFKLSKYSKEIEEKVKNDEILVLPESRKNEILSFIKEGLKDISVSRPKDKLPWGIPIPGDENQVFYVWFDALTNYISAVGLGLDQALLNKWWPADAHMVGKDILRFHATIWPGMLLSAKLPLPKTIIAHGFITSGGQKMSKSLGNVVSPVELVEKFGTDAVRYYLLREIPAQDDGDYSEEKFRERYNGELANGLGNLYARILTLAEKANFEISEEEFYNEKTKQLIAEVKSAADEKIDEYKFHEALGFIWSLVNYADGFASAEKPWENLDSKKEVMIQLLYILKNIGDLLTPFLPETSEKILNSIKIENGKVITKKGENLFPRL